VEKFYYLSGRYDLELAVGDAAMVSNHIILSCYYIWPPFVCFADFLCVFRKIHFYDLLAIWSWTYQKLQKKPHVLLHKLLTHSQNLGQRQRYHIYKKNHPNFKALSVL